MEGGLYGDQPQKEWEMQADQGSIAKEICEPLVYVMGGFLRGEFGRIILTEQLLLCQKPTFELLYQSIIGWGQCPREVSIAGPSRLPPVEDKSVGKVRTPWVL